ncbi:MAG TPA: ABC transporter permease [Terriglobales bacterium]|nr:ABC transporter permease [Terriglobales bacterium]
MQSTGLETFFQDLRHSVRLLRLNPGFTLIALISLALGIGANTAIFQLLDSVRLRMLPVKNPQELVEVRIDSKHGRSGSFVNLHAQMTTAQWEQLGASQQSFSDLFAWGQEQFNVSPSAEVQNVPGLYVSGDFFSSLGVAPILGRVLTAADDHRGCGLPGAVISYSFWQRQFGGDPSALGKTFMLDHHPVEVLGVTPASFFGMVVGERYDVAVPICAADVIEGEDSPLNVRWIWWLSVMGRLKPGMTMPEATAQLNSFAPALFKETLPTTFHGERADQYLAFRFKILPAGSGVSRLRDDYSTPLVLLLGIAGLVLLIACANLANLMLARASAREREIAVRLAVGASRARILRQLLVESLLIALLGAILGLGLAQWLSRFLVSFMSTGWLPLSVDLSPDWRVLGFTIGVAALTCVLFGLAPALRATRISPGAAMKAGSRGLTAGRERFGLRQSLVVSQVALSLVLLFGALLFTRTLRNLLTLDAGFQETGILVTDLDFSQLKIPEPARVEYKRQLVDRIRAIPGVESASTAWVVPISGNGVNDDVWMSQADRKSSKTSWFNDVSPHYFETLSTPLLAGRDFTDQDSPTSPKVAIVNESFAKTIAGNRNPVGMTFYREATSREPQRQFEIVGLVKDTKYGDLREDFSPIVYLPLAQDPQQYEEVQVLARSSVPVSSFTAAIRNAMEQTNPAITLKFTSIHTMISDSLVQERLMATLSGFFGFLAAVLATVGLYGVMSYMVIRRTNEIGIRMALGADRGGILAMVLREAGGLLGIGLILGIGLSIAGAITAKALLYGLKPYDPITLVAASVLLALVAVAASALPAKRASSLDPMVSLREE